MGYEFFTVRFGAPATAMLHALVGVEQAGDPFARVTVLVPDNLTGVMARRALAAAGGVANVSFVTPVGLAARVTGGALAQAGSLEVAACVREVLAAQRRGMFAPVAAHPATEAALVAAHRTLAGVAPDTLAELAASPSARTRAVVDLHLAVAARLAPLADEHQLARTAAAAVASDPSCLADLGALVVHLVDEVAPAHADLLRAIAALRPVRVLLGVTGVAGTETAALWWANHASDPALDHLPDPPPLPARPRAFSATDSDDEVRHVVRTLLARAEAGTPFSRMAVLWAAPQPYARLVLEHLAAAGIPHNGPAVRPLGGFVAGRAVLGLLALSSSPWRRRDIIDLASVAPGVVPGEGPRPVVAWDSLTRAAGVVAGLDDWRRKLVRHRSTVRSDTTRAQLASLTAFVDELAARLAAGAACGSWASLAAWLAESLSWLVGDPSGWPDDERHALDAVQDLVARLGDLEPFDRRPSPAACHRALTTALDTPSRRIGRLGHGVQCGPLEHARALDADLVVVLGLAEGLCPAPATEDTLLPDIERRRARHGELALATSRATTTHRSLLIGLASARDEVLVGVPRADHRGGRTRVPSRWLDHVAVAASGPPAPELFAHPRRPVEQLDSFEASLAAAPTTAHAAEQRLRLLRPLGVRFADHPVATPDLVRASVAAAARASSAFTEWDANLAGRPVPSPATSVTSSSRLEAWAECPFRYYASSVLRLTERDTPEAIDQVDARERGSILHLVLERFVREHLADPPAPGSPWPPAAAARLHEIADEEFAAAEARGATGPSVRWRREQLELRRVLDAFLDIDASVRAAFGSTPLAVELGFGVRDVDDTGPELAVTLPDGRTLAFRGVIDRVDRTAGGLLVLDYKTGKGKAYDAITAADPFVGGTKLQLPLYALAARRAFDAPHAEAHYLLLERNGERRGYRVDDAVVSRFADVLTEITDGIEHGVFLARPGAYDSFFGTHEACRFCDFDRMCPSPRGDHWEAKTAAAAPGSPLARYLRLAGVDAEEAPAP